MKKIKLSDIILIVLLLLAAYLEIFKVNFFPNNDTLNNIAFMILSRLVASIFFLILVFENKIRIFEKPKKVPLVLPCLLIVICNAPILELLQKKCAISAQNYAIILFAISCLMVGAFEELAFRGLLLPIALKKYAKNKFQILLCIIITSALFGCYHIINLFSGAGIGPTLSQIAYSTLIGAMCGAILLITGNVICPIIVHALFNFGGTLVDTFGSGEQWNSRRIIIFAIVSVFVLLYMVVIFKKSDEFELVENNK